MERHLHIEDEDQQDGIAHVVCNDCGWRMGVPIEEILPSEAIGIAAEQHPVCK